LTSEQPLTQVSLAPFSASLWPACASTSSRSSVALDAVLLAKSSKAILEPAQHELEQRVAAALLLGINTLQAVYVRLAYSLRECGPREAEDDEAGRPELQKGPMKTGMGISLVRNSGRYKRRMGTLH